MSSAPSVVVISLAIVLVVGLVVILSLRTLRVSREREARERFPNAKAIIPGANFFGQESRGVTQLRGNGTLILTDSELVFEMWLPRREFHLPLVSIQSLETPSSHLGKTVMRPLLKVVFRDSAGQTDSMAWYVPDTAGLKQVLEDLLQKAREH